MNYNNTSKVNDIKKDNSETEDEYIDYYDDMYSDTTEGQNNKGTDDFKNDDYFEDFDNTVEDTSSSSSGSNSNMKKQLIKLMLFIGVGFVVLFLILYVLSLFNHKTYSYESVEEIMIHAAESYFKDNSTSLPQDESRAVEIEVPTLVASNKMKSLDYYLGANHGCTGMVQVKKSGQNYVYIPYLTCPNKYQTSFLSDLVIKDQNIVSSGYGLYLKDGEYVFKGEILNNYVKMEARLWRIVKVNSDKTMMLITDEPVGIAYPYDDRYNQSIDYEYGINSFETSRVREALQTMYNELDSSDVSTYILSEKDKTHIIDYDICTGKIGENDTVHNNSKECSQRISGKVGLLTVSDYMNASADVNCNKVTSSSCQNYNYLATAGPFWLVTPSTGNTYTSFKVHGGSIVTAPTHQYNKIRPVITIASSTLITGGDGSESNPYVIK